MISINNLSVNFGGRDLLEEISFVVNDKDRIALVGRNGAGKSTMLKLIAGLQKPTSGEVSIPKGVKVGYLPQHMIHEDGLTVRQEAEKAFAFLFELQAEIESLGMTIAGRDDYESEEYLKLTERLAEATEKHHILGGSNFQGNIERTLLGLGFNRNDFDRQTSEFSGGWRMRVELAKILLQKPDILLLDEPTNHLDIESVCWLENFLKTCGAAVVLVSHDRAFLDNVTNRTIEISLGRIYDYKANYSHYVELRKERREQQIRAFENQQKQIADTEDFIERFRYKATKSVQVQSRIKMLDKIERIEVDMEDNSALHLKFPPAPHSGSVSVECKSLTKKYDEQVVLENLDMVIKRGEKVAFVGKNGEGKSTLVKCIMGQIPYEGELKLGHLVKIGYFAQNQASLLDENLTVFDTIDRVAVGEIRTRIKDILGAFMFGGEASEKKVKVLSGGERTRLAMIQLLLQPVNFLVLDEPTNHLDMLTKDVLKEAIKAFDGTVIVVSHDREFLDGLVEKTYEFTNHKAVEHLGGIYEFLKSKNFGELREIELSQSPTKSSTEDIKTPSDSKLSYEAQKERMKKVRKAEKAVEDNEKEIAELEAKVAEIEEKLSAADADHSTLLPEYEKCKKRLDEAMYEWEILSDELEKVKNS
ncbi:MAG: ABC-F family ATP-binding cassette domain-containing protein [Paludibacteraceae bacterium]|nr:ABC-F family ATP-binding cassette domain-containing protein [Paludibacteraceae bacterium]